MTILGGITFFYIDFNYYAGVIDTGVFIVPLVMQVFLGIYALIKGEKTFIKAGFLIFIFSVILFIIAIPGYTYEEAKQSVVNSYKVDEVELLSLDHKIVPTDKSSWFQNGKMYYAAVKKDEAGKQVDYYAVDPIQGDPIKLEEPYWQGQQ